MPLAQGSVKIVYVSSHLIPNPPSTLISVSIALSKIHLLTTKYESLQEIYLTNF